MSLIEIHEHELAEIKKKYNFSEEFNLLERLNQLPTAIALYPSIPRSGDVKTQVKKLSIMIEKLVICLRNTSMQSKIIINQIPEELINVGYKDIRGTNTDWQLSSFAF